MDLLLIDVQYIQVCVYLQQDCSISEDILTVILRLAFSWKIQINTSSYFLYCFNMNFSSEWESIKTHLKLIRWRIWNERIIFIFLNLSNIYFHGMNGFPWTVFEKQSASVILTLTVTKRIHTLKPNSHKCIDQLDNRAITVIPIQ